MLSAPAFSPYTLPAEELSLALPLQETALAAQLYKFARLIYEYKVLLMELQTRLRAGWVPSELEHGGKSKLLYS